MEASVARSESSRSCDDANQLSVHETTKGRSKITTRGGILATTIGEDVKRIIMTSERAEARRPRHQAEYCSDAFFRSLGSFASQSVPPGPH